MTLANTEYQGLWTTDYCKTVNIHVQDYRKFQDNWRIQDITGILLASHQISPLEFSCGKEDVHFP